MKTELPRYRVFISSPGDVVAERQRAALVLERVRKDYARHIRIEPYLWEYELMRYPDHFQDVIDSPGKFDLVIMVLWARLGTPLPEKTEKAEYRGRDGRVPVTGTEWEFEEAAAAQQARGAPGILVYKNRTNPSLAFKELDFRDARAVEAAQSQITALDRFWERYFADKGQFKAAYASYHSLAEFETKLESDLRRLIEEHLKKLRESDPSLPQLAPWPGNPFRGLEAYGFEHSAIYFGRGRAIDAAVTLLQSGAEKRRAFLLLLGASGSGKSSLAQAGIVPALSVPGFARGVGGWRRAVVNPGDSAAGPFAALADALLQKGAIPEIADSDERRSRLAESLQREGAAAELVRRTLEDIRAREQAGNRLLHHENICLALVVNQLEELYTRADFTASVRTAFVDALCALAETGIVYVIATMRSDQGHRLAETPKLGECAARFDVLPAGPAELIEMLRGTAEAAGIEFEHDATSGVGLDAVLAEEAAREPGALPLLSYLLDQLYRHDIEKAHGNRRLRYETAISQGGLKGAIAQRANEVLASQPDDVKAAFPRMLRALVSVGPGNAVPTTRQARLDQFPAGSPVRKLVDAFLHPSARLLVSDNRGDTTRVRVAHEALLTQWAAASEQIKTDRADLQVWARIEAAEALWREKGQDPTLLLQRGVPLDEAAAFRQRRSEEVEEDLLQFIDRSIESDRQKRAAEKKRARNRLYAQAAIAGVVVAAGTFGVLKAIEQVQIHSANTAALTARQLLNEQRYREVIQLALANLPDRAAKPDRPLNHELMAALTAAVERNRLQFRLADAGRGPAVIAFSPAGDRLLAASINGSAVLWDPRDGTTKWKSAEAWGPRCCVAFSADGKRFAMAARQLSVPIVLNTDGPQAPLIAKADADPAGSDAIESLAFDRTGDVVFGGLSGGGLKAWNLRTQQVHAVQVGPHPVSGVAYSAGCDCLATFAGDKDVRVWAASDLKPLAVLEGVARATYDRGDLSADGKRVVAVSWREARIWDLASKAVVRLSADAAKGLPTHEQSIKSVRFNPAATRVVTTSDDETARLWDARDGRLLRELPHAGKVRDAEFDGTGSRVVTAAWGDTVGLWSEDERKRADDEVLRDNWYFVSNALFNPKDDTQLASVAEDGIVRVWSVKVPQAPLLRAPARRAVFAPDGKWIAVAGLDGQVRTLSTTGDPQAAPKLDFVRHEHEIIALAFDADGTRLTTASGDGTARVWNLKTRESVELVAHSGRVITSNFDRNGTSVATATEGTATQGGLAQIWDAARGTLVTTLVAPGARQSCALPSDAADTAAARPIPLWSAFFSPTAEQVVISCENKVAMLWDTVTGNRLAILSQGGAVGWARFSPQGDKIITLSDDHTAHLWNAQGQPLGPPLRHDADEVLRGADFSPDGSTVVTSTGRGRLYFWDVATYQLKAIRFASDGDMVFSVAYDRSGDHVVTASHDGTSRVIDARIDLQAVLDRGRQIDARLRAEPLPK